MGNRRWHRVVNETCDGQAKGGNIRRFARECHERMPGPYIDQYRECRRLAREMRNSLALARYEKRSGEWRTLAHRVLRALDDAALTPLQHMERSVGQSRPEEPCAINCQTEP
jgi:hypothetical protein